ncbi:unnamed protein product [Prorocentrum cordatum]|uniref:Uncharacterized protein n=1 Tax=Prorocentrum cordatum TaxID=2364126 RepID=A0ABN9ULR3_9DINO|nr:unnamed protein product [Polarella glacialis]
MRGTLSCKQELRGWREWQVCSESAWLKVDPSATLRGSSDLGELRRAIRGCRPHTHILLQASLAPRPHITCSLISAPEEPVARMRGRAFGAWRRGARGAELLRAALEAGDAHLAEAGFAFRVCNLDQDHPLRNEVFEKPSFRTLFLQKDLVAGARGPPPLWEPESFHDPRDI